MKRKPLFITLIIALALVGVVAVVLFMKNKTSEAKVLKTFHKSEVEPEPEPEEETDEPVLSV